MSRVGSLGVTSLLPVVECGRVESTDKDGMKMEVRSL
jgi:hypothetical protein